MSQLTSIGLCFAEIVLAGVIMTNGAPSGDKMSSEDARVALVEMVEHTKNSDLRELLEKLKKTKPKPAEGGVIKIDLWHIDL